MTESPLASFTESLGFVVFFLVGTLFFTVVFGDDVAFWYLLLVLLGMAMTNWDKFDAVIRRYSGA